MYIHCFWLTLYFVWCPDPQFPFRLHVRPYKLTFNTLLSPAPMCPRYIGLKLLLSVSVSSTKGRGKTQRPALFCTEARLTGGKRAIGPGGTIRFPVKSSAPMRFCFFCSKPLNYSFFSKNSIAVKQTTVKITKRAMCNSEPRVKMSNLSCRSAQAAARRVNEDVEELLAAVCVGPPAAQQGQ